jgi:hypothetical protein
MAAVFLAMAKNYKRMIMDLSLKTSKITSFSCISFLKRLVVAENQGQKFHFSLVADRLMIGGNYKTSCLDSDQLTKEQPTMLCCTRNL